MSERYGDYELLRHIATGGMAEIHLARHHGPGRVERLVVVKRMLPQLAVRPDFVTMFQDEARLTLTLVHPNIIRVHELGEHAGTYFIAMELVDGPHLGALFAHSLRARSPLPIDLCCWVVARAADGLHHAHDQHDPVTGAPLNLVHRDISPQNILVGRQGDVKVTDFGVAKASTQQTRTRTGIIKGKVAYMSPEQCLGDSIDRRTDVFALGIVLYELATRRRLFHHLKSDLLVMQEITGKDIPRASTANPEVDPRLDDILVRALSRDVGARYPTASSLAAALDEWLADRVDARALATWFEQNCLALAPSLQIPAAPARPVEPVVAVVAVASRADTTLATPSPPGMASATHVPAAPEATVVSAPPRSAARPDDADSDATVRLDPAPGPRVRGAARAGDRRTRASVVAVVGAVIAAGAVAAIGAQIVRVPEAPSPAQPVAAAAPPAPSTGRLKLTTTPPGVTVLAGDSRVLGRSPIDVDLAPGPVRLQAQFPDQPPRAVDAVIVAGASTEAVIHAWVPLVVRSTPSGAKVRIDGALRGETPFEQGFLVEPGKAVTVRLEAPGFAPWEEQRVADPGAPLEWGVRMLPAVPAAATGGGGGAGAGLVAARDEFGAIRVNVDPWANVKLGDVVLGEAPFHDKRVRAGRQVLTLTNPEMGLKDAFPVVVPADKTLVVILRYEKKGAAWVLAQKTIR